MQLVSVTVVETRSEVSIFVFVSGDEKRERCASRVIPFVVLQAKREAPVDAVMVGVEAYNGPVDRLVATVRGGTVALVGEEGKGSF